MMPHDSRFKARPLATAPRPPSCGLHRRGGPLRWGAWARVPTRRPEASSSREIAPTQRAESRNRRLLASDKTRPRFRTAGLDRPDTHPVGLPEGRRRGEASAARARIRPAGTRHVGLAGRRGQAAGGRGGGPEPVQAAVETPHQAFPGPRLALGGAPISLRRGNAVVRSIGASLASGFPAAPFRNGWERQYNCHSHSVF